MFYSPGRTSQPSFVTTKEAQTKKITVRGIAMISILGREWLCEVHQATRTTGSPGPATSECSSLVDTGPAALRRYVGHSPDLFYGALTKTRIDLRGAVLEAAQRGSLSTEFAETVLHLSQPQLLTGAVVDRLVSF